MITLAKDTVWYISPELKNKFFEYLILNLELYSQLFLNYSSIGKFKSKDISAT